MDDTIAALSKPCRRLVTGLLAALLLMSLSPTPALASRVFLDPGHGGYYPGAVYAGIREADVNLWIAREIRSSLTTIGHEVAMSRDSDVTIGNGALRPVWHWDDDGIHFRYCDESCVHNTMLLLNLQARCDMANWWGADVFISIHANASTWSGATGAETYINWDNAVDTVLSRLLAEYVQEEIIANTDMTDRGVKETGYYVIRWSNMPAILIETGFLSNDADRALLLDADFRREVGQAVAAGVDRFLATDPFSPLYPRLAGLDRYRTAAEVALEGWPKGADTVLLASGENWPDALAATPLSAKLDAPILLTNSSALSTVTAGALRTLDPDEIVILGGPGAVDEDVEEMVRDAMTPDPTIRRLAGMDRYETATLIAAEVGVPASGLAFLASGENYPDALSISSIAGMELAPILLTRLSSLPDATQAFLTEGSRPASEVVIVGGTGVVSEDTEEELRGWLSVERLCGANRYETNLAVLNAYWDTGAVEPLVATANDFPDALVAGTLASKRGQPIVLAGRGYMPAKIREMIMNAPWRFGEPTFIGGKAALAPVLEYQFLKARRYY